MSIGVLCPFVINMDKDMEATIMQLNDMVWKHTKQVETNKKRFQQESATLIEHVGELTAQCNKTERFIADIESRLEQAACTPTQAETLLVQMLETAQAISDSTRNALEKSKKRLEKLRADYAEFTELYGKYSDKIKAHCAENASLLKKWQDLLGCKIDFEDGVCRVDFGDDMFILEKADYGYRIKHGNASAEYIFDGSFPRLLLTICALRPVSI